MTLRERLQRRTPFGYGSRPYFVVNGRDVWGVSGLVDEVLDRYSSRFGAITSDSAEKMRVRLSKAYAGNAWGIVMRAWENRNPMYFEYPQELRKSHAMMVFRATIECMDEHRPFVLKEAYESEKREFAQQQKEAKKEADKKLLAQYQKVWKDEANLKECRRILKQIKEIYRESSKDNRAIA